MKRKKMRTVRGTLPYLLAAVMCVSLVLSGAQTARADTAAVDLNKTGSITVTLLTEKDGDPVPSGMLSLYRAADLLCDADTDWNMVYDFTDDFAGCGLSLSDLSSDLAADLADYIEQMALVGTSLPVDLNGKATFSDLPVGVYVIVQTQASDGYYAIAPFLVTVPVQAEDGSFLYDVDAEPKMEKLTELPPERETETEEEPTTEGETETEEVPGIETETETEEVTVPEDETDSGTPEKLPQTGQLNWPIVVLSVFGVLLLAAGGVIRGRSYAKRS